MIQMALIRPAWIASNRSTALRPGREAIRGLPQNSCTMRRCSGVIELHVRGEHVGHTAHFPAAHGIGLAGQGERPHARAGRYGR